MAPPKVLVVEDDADLRRLVARGLEEEGFVVRSAASGAAALETVVAARPQALVIDIGLPDSDGRDVCQALRAEGIDAPVLFLTARDSVPDRLSGFSAGADDYIVKPFEFAELVARLRAIVRRAGVETRTVVSDLSLDPAAHAAAVGD